MDRRTLRRFDIVNYNQALKFDKAFRENELNRYSLIDFDPELCEKHIVDHADYTYLLILCCYRDNFFDEFQFERLIDKIDGYFFGYLSDMITPESFCRKMNEEIINTWVYQNGGFNKIAIYNQHSEESG